MATKSVSLRPTPATVAAAAAGSHAQPYDEELPLNEATDQPADKAPTAAAKTPAKSTRAKKSPTVKLEDVTFTEIKPAAPDTFQRKTNLIPDDYPLMVAFRRSYDTKSPVDIATDDPATIIKVIRRIAAQEAKGVQVKPREGFVAFQAQDRKKVVRKKSGA